MSSNPYDLTPEQAARVNRSVHEFVKAARQDPKLRAEVMEKLALFPEWMTAAKPPANPKFHQSMLRHAYTLAPYMLAGAGLAAVGGVAESGVRALYDRGSLALSYRKMLQNNPDLEREDSSKVQQAFKTLHRVNPEYAKDPLISGTFVKNTIGAESLHLGDVNQLVQARRAMAQRPDGFFARGSDMAGTLAKTHESVTKGPQEQQKLELQRAKDVREEAIQPHKLDQVDAEANYAYSKLLEARERREAEQAQIAWEEEMRQQGKNPQKM